MEKERFKLKHFSLFQFILKLAINNFSKMFYIGKSMTVRRDIASQQQKNYIKRYNIMYLFQLLHTRKNFA